MWIRCTHREQSSDGTKALAHLLLLLPWIVRISETLGLFAWLDGFHVRLPTCCVHLTPQTSPPVRSVFTCFGYLAPSSFGLSTTCGRDALLLLTLPSSKSRGRKNATEACVIAVAAPASKRAVFASCCFG
jgi:hypothetical protein